MKRMCLAAILSLLTCSAHAQQKVSVSAGYSYMHSDQGEQYAKLHGWFGQVSVAFTSHLSLVVEADNYFGAIAGGSMNQHNYVIGPRYTFRSPQARFRPLVYAQAGDQRNSTANEIVNGYNLQLGGGFSLNMSRRVSLNIIPIEYSFVDNYEFNLSSYAAKVGLNFTLWQKGPKRK